MSLRDLIFSAAGNSGGGDEGELKFLGELDSTFLTYSTLSNYFNVTEGAINTTAQANKWLHFQLEGVELVVSKVAVRNYITWDHLYSKGLVYGVDGDGSSPTGTPTNQLKTITIQGKTYKVRLLKGADPGNDPFPISTTGYDLVGTQQSEWSRLFYPIVIDDPNAKSYTGPRLANYTEADLQMRWINEVQTPGSFAWCQEKHPGSGTRRVLRGYLGPSYLDRSNSSVDTSPYGWWVCLELIS